jgi:hypothetical protein
LDGWSACHKAATDTGQKKHRQTSMPWVGFEPMIPAFEWLKTLHALDCAATVISCETWHVLLPLVRGMFYVHFRSFFHSHLWVTLVMMKVLILFILISRVSKEDHNWHPFSASLLLPFLSECIVDLVWVHWDVGCRVCVGYSRFSSNHSRSASCHVSPDVWPRGQIEDHFLV